MSQAEQSQALVVPKSLIWNSSHAAVFALNSIGACLFDRDFWVVTMILTVPLAIGAVQVFLLDKILHWRVLWPIASVFGAMFSYSCCGFIGVAFVGFGMGLFQVGLLSKSGFRQPWWWMFASGMGWGFATQAMGLVTAIFGISFFRNIDEASVSFLAFVSGVGGLVFGVTTSFGISNCDFQPPKKLELLLVFSVYC